MDDSDHLYDRSVWDVLDHICTEIDIARDVKLTSLFLKVEHWDIIRDWYEEQIHLAFDVQHNGYIFLRSSPHVLEVSHRQGLKNRFLLLIVNDRLREEIEDAAR